jgi:hypothetical protein
MFSTVDSPGARFLRIYLITPDGQIAAMLPDELSSAAKELRALPTQSRLESLARKLSSGVWVSYSPVSATRYYNYLASLFLPEKRANYAFDPGMQLTSIVSQDTANVRFVQMLPRDKVAPPFAAQLTVTGVRAELWKYQFDSQRQLITAERALFVVVPRGGR